MDYHSSPKLFCFFVTVVVCFASSVTCQYNCSRNGNYTNNSTYQTNLNNVLSAINSNTDIDYGFYNFSSTGNSDRAHAIALCRGDVTVEVCKQCLSEATTKLTERCPNQKEAIGWFDKCMLRYSNSSNIFGTYASRPYNFLSNVLNVTNPDKFSAAFGELMANLSIRASSGDGRHKFASGQMVLESSENLNGLVQCTPDLTSIDCLSCLTESINNIRGRIAEKRGGILAMPSCYAWFGMYDSSSSLPPSGNTPNLPSGRKNRVLTIVGVIASTVFVALLVASCLCYRYRSKNSHQGEPSDAVRNLDGRSFFDDYSSEKLSGNSQAKSEEFPLIPLNLIKTATDNFSDTNKLGQGGFGPVYKGILPDGKEIAVKRLSETSGQGLEEFKNEIILIAKLQHKNLVRLLGCCLEAKELLLIYEYMPNKSLDILLFDASRSSEVDWKGRLVILNGTARGLLYLHEDSRLRIIHRDLKTSNVLLDNEMNPKISDFGMARIFDVNQVEANTNGVVGTNNSLEEMYRSRTVVGTYGYMAPEYAMEGLFSVKSDVYSYGVLLLEIISGKRNDGLFVKEHGHNLLAYAWKLWCDGRALELMDPTLEETYTESEVLKCIQIGLMCVQDDPADRPTMSYVVAVLRSDNNTSLPQPSQPLFPVVRLVTMPGQATSSSLNEITISNVSPR